MAGSAWALKEWSIAVEALLSGDLILLIRKGGIRETQPVFQCPSDRALLFPTYEHQTADALRAPYDIQPTPQAVPAIGDPVPIGGWAEITHQLLLPGPAGFAPLHPFHIWTDGWLRDRLAWKPDRPAYLLLLRVHRFVQPMVIPYQQSYRGCRSWVTVNAPDPLPDSAPVLSIDTYESRVADLQAALVTAQNEG